MNGVHRTVTIEKNRQVYIKIKFKSLFRANQQRKKVGQSEAEASPNDPWLEREIVPSLGGFRVENLPR